MSWLDKIVPSIARSSRTRGASKVPEGLWKKCPKCDAMLYRPELEKHNDVCPKCDHHMRISARRRLDMFLDQEGREELATDVVPVDRLKFKDVKKYRDRLNDAQKATGETDALIAMRGAVQSIPVVAVAFEFSFHGGSMGYVVGEKFTRAAKLALKENLPLVCFSATGGARMQEALISLMQMAKTSAVIERLKQQGTPYISIMTDPVYGGVSASLALLGDINAAEPGARAGFAGPNIIEQTIRQKLPAGFQRSEFLLEHGAIDMIIHRNEMRDKIAALLAKFLRLPEVDSALLGASSNDALTADNSVDEVISEAAAPESEAGDNTDAVAVASTSTSGAEDASADDVKQDAEIENSVDNEQKS